MVMYVAKRSMGANMERNGGGRLVGRTKGGLIKEELRGGRNGEGGEGLEGLEGS